MPLTGCHEVLPNECLIADFDNNCHKNQGISITHNPAKLEQGWNYSLKSKQDFQIRTQELRRMKTQKGRTKSKNNKTGSMKNSDMNK
jgi:hypothetical protein